jgi:hypothetical protein
LIANREGTRVGLTQAGSLDRSRLAAEFFSI